MKRKEFLKACSLFGLSLPFQKLIVAEEWIKESATPFKGKVLVIGAGAAGLAATYYLKQRGITADLLEASDTIGGRMKVDRNFTDFPLPLGAEWLESKPTVFDTLVNDEEEKIALQLVADEPDYKFINYSWLQFFEDYILPSIHSQITLQQEVKSIDYSEAKIKVNTQDRIWEADYLILAVPLKVLQANMIQFKPLLPSKKRRLIQEAKIWDGFKAFVKFSKGFYEKDFEFKLQDDQSGQKFIYDATKGQNSKDFIIGVLAMGKAAKAYQGLSEDGLLQKLLTDLDKKFDQQASQHYSAHLVQDWQKEPFIQSGYLSDHADWRKVKQLQASVDDRIFFAGGAFTDGEDWVSVHTAAFSAKQAVDAIVG